MGISLDNVIQQPKTSELDIYEGGALNQITIPDLLNNEVAIRQLVNNYNIKLGEVDRNAETISNLRSSLEYHRTAPFTSIIAVIINVLGTIITGIGVNQLTNEGRFAHALLIAGGLLVLVGSISTILFPYAKDWFNAKKPRNA